MVEKVYVIARKDGFYHGGGRHQNWHSTPKLYTRLSDVRDILQTWSWKTSGHDFEVLSYDLVFEGKVQ